MTDVLKTPEKKRIRIALLNAAFSVLEREGWKVGEEDGGVRGRVRQITKDGRKVLAAIRTTQDTYIAFHRNEDDTKWVTLSDVDVVIVASVDSGEQPKFAQVHILDAKELQKRFDRAYTARRKAGHSLDSIRKGRGVWISLYLPESNEPVNRVGAGIGLEHPPIVKVALGQPVSAAAAPTPSLSAAGAGGDDDFAPLTFAQAKIRLARTLGIDPANIKITVEA